MSRLASPSLVAALLLVAVAAVHYAEGPRYYPRLSVDDGLAVGAWAALAFLGTTYALRRFVPALTPGTSGPTHWSTLYFAVFGRRIVSLRFVAMSLLAYIIALCLALLLWNVLDPLGFARWTNALRGLPVELARRGGAGWWFAGEVLRQLGPHIIAAPLLQAAIHATVSALGRRSEAVAWTMPLLLLAIAVLVGLAMQIVVLLHYVYVLRDSGPWPLSNYLFRLNVAVRLFGGWGNLAEGIPIYANGLFALWCATHCVAVQWLRRDFRGLLAAASERGSATLVAWSGSVLLILAGVTAGLVYHLSFWAL